jgi:hypothetical protein
MSQTEWALNQQLSKQGLLRTCECFKGLAGENFTGRSFVGQDYFKAS